MHLGGWVGLRAGFEQYELDRSEQLVLSDKARLTASWPDRTLTLDYELKLGNPCQDLLTVRDEGFSWERRRSDGSVERPSGPADSVSDHGLWGLLDPGALVRASVVLRDSPVAGEYVLQPFLTHDHVHPDGIATTTHRLMPSWVSAAPALYVPDAALYEAALDSERRVLESLTALRSEDPRLALRSWRLGDIEYS